jgi:hypothetical protein
MDQFTKEQLGSASCPEVGARKGKSQPANAGFSL